MGKKRESEIRKSIDKIFNHGRNESGLLSRKSFSVFENIKTFQGEQTKLLQKSSRNGRMAKYKPSQVSNDPDKSNQNNHWCLNDNQTGMVLQAMPRSSIGLNNETKAKGLVSIPVHGVQPNVFGNSRGFAVDITNLGTEPLKDGS